MFLVLPYQNGGMCANLLWQKHMLERIQRKCDRVTIHNAEELSGIDFKDGGHPDPDLERDDAKDKTEMQFLDQLLASHSPDEVMEDENAELDNVEADIQDRDAGSAGFTAYINKQVGADPHPMSQNGIPDAPNCDALNNQYIRVVYTNGIHHIALVSCRCQGHENITTNLIYAGWVPTSFVQV